MATNYVSVAIAFHNGGARSARIARAVHAGASDVADVEAVLVRVEDIGEADWVRLDSAHAIIFGSPTYMGTASAAFHAFAQASGARWAAQTWRDKIAGGFTLSGSSAGDKSSTLGYFATLAAQHGMIWVNLGLPDCWNPSIGEGYGLNRLGYYNGAAAQTAGEKPDDVHPSDLGTAEHLGRRVAEYARLVAAGRASLTAAAATGARR